MQAAQKNLLFARFFWYTCLISTKRSRREKKRRQQHLYKNQHQHPPLQPKQGGRPRPQNQKEAAEASLFFVLISPKKPTTCVASFLGRLFEKLPPTPVWQGPKMPTTPTPIPFVPTSFGADTVYLCNTRCKQNGCERLYTGILGLAALYMKCDGETAAPCFLLMESNRRWPNCSRLLWRRVSEGGGRHLYMDASTSSLCEHLPLPSALP